MKSFYEDVLRTVGEFGPWQVKMIISLWLPMMLCGFQWVSTDFMAMEPRELFCHYEECKNNFSSKTIFQEPEFIRDKLEHYGKIFPEVVKSYGGLEESGTLSTLWSTMPISLPFCKIYIPNIDSDGICDLRHEADAGTYNCKADVHSFMFPDYFDFSTLVTEFNLVCDNYWGQVTFAVACAVGSFLGSIVMAVMADRIGRRPTLFISMLIMGSAALAETLMPSFELVLLMVFFNSFGRQALFQICLLILFEIIGVKKRFKRFYWISYNSLAGVTFFIPYSLGKLIGTVNFSIFTDWREAELWFGVLTLCLLVIVWFIKETPRWLLSKHKIHEAKTLLGIIAKTNSRKVDVSIRINQNKERKKYDQDGSKFTGDSLNLRFEMSDDEAERCELIHLRQREYSLGNLFVPETLQYTLAFMWAWPLIHLIKIGLDTAEHGFSESEQVELPFSSYFIKFALEIAALIFTAITEGIMGRRTNLISSLLMCTIMFFAIGIRGIPMGFKRVFVHVACFSCASAFALIVLVTMSVYPSSLRARTLGIFTAWASVGEILAPIIINYIPYIGSQDISFFIMGITSLIGTILCYYLPETLGRPLPETMDDVLFLRRRNPAFCTRIKYERKFEGKVKYVPVDTAPLIRIPNFDTAPTEEIKMRRQQLFGVNYLNDAFNMAEIERQTNLQAQYKV